MSAKACLNAGASINRHMILGSAVVVFLAVGLGGWASTAEISGALMRPRFAGRRISNVKKVVTPDRRRSRGGARP